VRDMHWFDHPKSRLPPPLTLPMKPKIGTRAIALTHMEMATGWVLPTQTYARKYKGGVWHGSS
jgi:hypothetical protein